MAELASIQVRGPVEDRFEEILTDGALEFLAQLHQAFEPRRRALLEDRARRQAAIDAGDLPSFLPSTRDVREGDWQVAEVPEPIQERRVEITGPTDRKMMINALNSGANVFMADFEDSNVPTWQNMLQGQVNLKDAVAGTIRFEKDSGKVYELEEDHAVLFVRPRGLHLLEERILIDGDPVAGGLVDFGLHMYHNAEALVDSQGGPYFYLPKLESHEEARLWDDAFVDAQELLGLPQGTIKATVLVETLPAAFEMEEILYELREHSGGLNAGRWDYIFSAIKTFREHEDRVLPDRGQISMTVPFMRAYTELLVRTCHKRGAHAMGGMAAFIPSKDPEVNEKAFAEVQADKEREATDGFDGTWIAHPGLVDVAREEFDKVLGDRPNQIDNKREDVDVEAADLLAFDVEDGTITEEGLQTNVNVGLQYLASWLDGWGAAAIDNLMEDTATAEISRAQVWQWTQHGATLEDGTPVDAERVRQVIGEEIDRISDELGDRFDAQIFERARTLFSKVALDDEFHSFLTLPGQEMLD